MDEKYQLLCFRAENNKIVLGFWHRLGVLFELSYYERLDNYSTVAVLKLFFSDLEQQFKQLLPCIMPFWP